MFDLRVNIAVIAVLLMYALTGSATKKGAPVYAAPQTVTIVQGQTATLRAASVNGVAFQWLKNGVFIPGATQTTYVVSTAGSYQVLSTNAANCTSDLSDPVIVNVQQANFTDVAIGINAVKVSDNMDDPFRYTIMLKNNGPVTATDVNVQNKIPAEVSYKSMDKPAKGTADYDAFNNNITWRLAQLDVGETTSLTYTVKALKVGRIENTATVSSQPADMDLANNTASTTLMMAGLYIPNVFTPNGDGVNDTFEIPNLNTYIANELSIVNRWNATVYEKKNYQNDWTGSGLNEGTYFYLLKVQTANGKWDIYKGYITLIRTIKSN
ncbi:T9SS type B sorting domain-containing protein [Mucilaginibacter myungsuensis]|uniref:Gliding motility-associated C-terminal domain-containing protein n=1 Tax=Mucilaginibacter myungsuensis TaxID=649104 RepID=A0A929L056_9SPHI|nr:gliding motility-associated C-terminal domain-containing protein [Mucilaginibacter myungsuensis]MBE9660871.1 gliding motility-associated C-terminal domain-containing protein [Mucilaginibacter myungsuensis]MDN3600918.1 gliding motility-associated C-terminal domain-containing protein [Mucilaginibacter myungsuensis]